MIVVVADDLAGAAEMAGMALRHGLTSEVQSDFDPRADVDLIVADTDSRSCTAEEAGRRVARVARQCRRHGTEHTYKKVDSVLRGHVVAELGAWLEAVDLDRALLVPANPNLGRVVRDGCYYIGGRPLHETDFAADPEYPATTAEVRGILGPGGAWPVEVLLPGEALPDRGILVGEATSSADLAAWAHALDASTLAAGASEFFAAFLEAKGIERDHAESANADPCSLSGSTALFVCGSTSASSHAFCTRCDSIGLPVLRMPPGLFEVRSQTSALLDEWAGDAVRALEARGQAMVAIDQPVRQSPGLPHVLSRHMGRVVEKVLASHPVDRLYVEGGATAVALVRQLGWRRLRALRELATGVVCMRVEGQAGPQVTMKPGSYAWPDKVLRSLDKVRD